MKRILKNVFVYSIFYLLGIVALQMSFTSYSYAQPVADCNNAVPFCGSASLSFPSSVSTTAPAGPNYGCLYTVPNPTWYYMQADQSGSIKLHMNGGGLDVDFASWGPFTNPTAGCASIMSGTPPIQSSYSSATTEDFALGMSGGVGSGCPGPGASSPPAAVAGQFYIVLITNYTNSSGNLSFTQTAGTGSTNCAITQPCQIGNMTANSVCTGAGTGTTLSGTIDYMTTMTTGTLTVSSSCGGSQSYPFTAGSTASSSLTYSFPGGAGNAQNCTVTASFTSNAGCSTTATFVEPNCGCNITLTPVDPTICVGNTVTLTPSTTGGTWTSSNTSVATVNSSGVITGVAAGTATITYTNASCSGTSQVTVSASTTPIFTNPGPICSGTAFTLPTTSNNGISGTWSPAINNTTTTTYTFTPTAGSCGTTTTMQVVVNPQTTPTFTSIPAICSGGTFTLPTTSNNGITGTWAPAINNTATTTYTFTPSGGTCVNTATMQVVVNPQVTPTFTNAGPICSGASLTLPTTSNNGVTGTWSPAVNNTATTTYTFTPSGGTCTNSTTMQVVVDPSVTPTFTNPGPICLGNSFTLPTTSNNAVVGTWSPAVDLTATKTYTFTPTGATCAVSTTMQVVVTPPVTPTFTNPGPVCSGLGFTLPTTSNNGISGTWSPAVDSINTATYTFTPSVGSCANTTTMQVVITPKTTPTFNLPDSLCAASSLTFPTTSVNGISGTWSPALDNTQTMAYTFTPNIGECAVNFSKTINIKPKPDVMISTNNGSIICVGDSVHIAIQSNPVGAIIQWTATNNGTSGAISGLGNSIDNQITLTNSTTSGTVTYQITGTYNGCASTPAIVTFTVNPPLATTATLTSTLTTVEEGETTNLNVTMNPYIPGVLYTWTPSNNLSCSDCPNPIATPDSATCYVVTLSAPNVCPLIDSVCVSYRIKCGEIFIPSIFSPNSDGNNDYFKVYGRCLVKVQMSIYDRWGNQVFYSDDLTEGWDGTYKGKLMNSGTFVYRLNVTTLYGEPQSFKGNVTLAR